MVGTEVTIRGPRVGYATSVIEYASTSQMPQVNTLEKEIPGATAKQVTSLKGGTLSLVLGSGFQGVAHKSHKKAKSVSAAALSKNYGGVNGAANICKQSAAYAGPDTPADFGN